MNKGFTLIEIIGVVVILAVLSLIAFPAILNVLDNSNKEVDEKTQDFLMSAARSYFNDNKDSNKTTVDVYDLMKEGYVSTTVICDDCTLAKDKIIKNSNGTLTYEVGSGNDNISACQANCKVEEAS